MKALYLVPALAVLGLSMSVHADGEEDLLQVWKDYVEEYRQYMEDYKQWAADRFESYENSTSELADQLDEKNSHIQELEEGLEEWRTAYFRAIDDRASHIHGLEEAVGDRDERIRELEELIGELREDIRDRDERIRELEADTQELGDERIRELEPTPSQCSPGYVRADTLCIPEPGSPKTPIGGMTWEDYRIYEEASRQVMQEREGQETYLTIDRQTYTLGDVIHITGKTFVDEWPDHPGSFDTIIPAYTEYAGPGVNIMHVAIHHDYYETRCSHPESGPERSPYESYESGPDHICRSYYDAHCEHPSYPDDEYSCKSYEVTPIDPEYNDDGTYSFGIALEDHLPLGEYWVYDGDLIAVFTLTPPDG